MYCDFFGFTEKPFTITPNPRFIFLSKNHKEVFAHLLYGIRNHCGFIEITGEVGTGKTTALRTLLNQLESDSYRLAFIFNPSHSAQELLHSINAEFGIESTAFSAADLLSALNGFLLRENAAGRTVVLVIDEAQNLQPEVLEQIRMLSNLETETDKLIQIILVGQPELGAILARPELRQLSQRITVRYHLQPMDFDDAGAYIRHRLDVAGCRDGELFSARAIRKIYRFAKGFPRLINILCDRALLVAYTEDSRHISSAMVDTAISELQRQTRAAGTRLRLWPAFASVAACLAVMGGWLYWWHDQAKVAPLAAIVHADEAQDRKPVALPPSKVPSPEVLSTLRRNLAAVDQPGSATAAFNGLAALWGAEPLPAGQQISNVAGFVKACNQRNLSVTPYRGSLDSLISLNSPALLELTLPGVVGYRYLSLISVSGGQVTVSPAASGRSDHPLSELQGLWSGNSYLPWTNHLNLPNIGRPGEAGEEVRQLQDMLINAGVYNDAPTGRYDSATRSAVTRFQASRGIVPDGRVGPQTLMLLYQAAGKFSQPKLKPVRLGEGS